MAAAGGAAEGRPLPGPPGGRPRPVCSRPYFVVLMVFAHLYVLNVLGLLLFVHLSAGDADPDPDLPPAAPSPGPAPTAALPRREGIKVGHEQRLELVPGRVHVMRTLSLKPLLFGTKALHVKPTPSCILTPMDSLVLLALGSRLPGSSLCPTGKCLHSSSWQ